MKKLFIVVLIGIFTITAFGLQVNDIVNTSIYNSKGFKAEVKQETQDEKGNTAKSNYTLYNKGDFSRVDMKLTSEMMKNPAQLQQRKMMGLDERQMIIERTEDDTKVMVIYPRNQAYFYLKNKQALDQIKSSGGYEKTLKKKVEKLGKEKINEKDLVKYKVLENEENIKENYMYIDPKDKLIKASKTVTTDGAEVFQSMNNFEIGIDNSVFSEPKGYTKYKNAMDMQRAIMQQFGG